MKGRKVREESLISPRPAVVAEVRMVRYHLVVEAPDVVDNPMAEGTLVHWMPLTRAIDVGSMLDLKIEGSCRTTLRKIREGKVIARLIEYYEATRYSFAFNETQEAFS